MVEMITQVNNAINGVVWGPFGLALLFCTGFWMSARTGFFQFRKMGYWLRHTTFTYLSKSLFKFSCLK